LYAFRSCKLPAGSGWGGASQWAWLLLRPRTRSDNGEVPTRILPVVCRLASSPAAGGVTLRRATRGKGDEIQQGRSRYRRSGVEPGRPRPGSPAHRYRFPLTAFSARKGGAHRRRPRHRISVLHRRDSSDRWIRQYLRGETAADVLFLTLPPNRLGDGTRRTHRKPGVRAGNVIFCAG
jgi:hypothetical protein